MTLLFPPDATLTRDSRRFLEQWNRWRGTNLLPRWSDIQFAALSDMVPRMVALEFRSATDVPFIYVGAVIEYQLGLGLVGKNYIDLAPPNGRGLRGELMSRVVGHPCAAVNFYELELQGGLRTMVEIATAPVRPDDDRDPMRLICAVSNEAVSDADQVARIELSEGQGLRYLDIGAGVPPLNLGRARR